MLLLVIASGACAQEAAQQTGSAPAEQQVVDPVDINEKQAKELIDKSSPFILDVRTEKEYRLGHLEDAVLIPVNQLRNRWTEIKQPKDKEILVYCYSGQRSHSAAWFLVEHGFTKVYNLKSGIIAWYKAGYPIVK